MIRAEARARPFDVEGGGVRRKTMHFSSKFAAALAVSSALTALPAVSHAALSPALKCETGKLKTVASFASCLLKTEAKAVADMASPDFTKCREKINTKFPKYEANAGLGICPSEGDVTDIRDRTEVFESEIAILLAGGDIPTCGDGNVDPGEGCDTANLDGETCASQGFFGGTLTCGVDCQLDTTACDCTMPVMGDCGDGNIDPGEDCDVGDLGGATCASEGFFNGTLLCGAGCQYDTTQCNLNRFQDTGTTIIDFQTGLEWESKTNSDGVVNLANAHDVDNTYTWTGTAMGTAQSGTLFTDFLVKLNGSVDHATTTTLSCFASHCDWRVPTIDELKTLHDPVCAGPAPCIVDAEFAPNRSGRYWSNSTRVSGGGQGAYFLDFVKPIPVPVAASDAKTSSYFARAVRRR
jgi:hypothetical protein